MTSKLYSRQLIVIILIGLFVYLPCSAALERLTVESDSTYDYLLYLPPGYSNDVGSWPLIVFLHGGWYGTTLIPIEQYAVFPGYPNSIEQRKKDFPAIVVAPHFTGTQPTTEEPFPWYPSKVRAFINHVAALYRVDMDRVYITGQSLGGIGTWAFGLNEPDMPAALAPASGICPWLFPNDIYSIVSRDPNVLRDIPIWANHGALDTSLSVYDEQFMVNVVRASGGFPRFTIYPLLGHDVVPQAAYESAAFNNWLFSQTRSKATSTTLAITGYPKPISITMGQSATFNVENPGDYVGFHWQRKPTISSLWADLHEGGTYTGVTTANLVVGVASLPMAGDRFRCVLQKADGSTIPTQDAALAVRLPAGSNYMINAPTGLAIDRNGDLIEADAGRHTISRVTTVGIFSQLAGIADTDGYVDMTGQGMLLNQPFGIVVGTDGYFYISDSANSVIRQLAPGGGIAAVFAGSVAVSGANDATGSAARFGFPTGLAVGNDGTLFVTDIDTIRRISPTGVVVTLAGSPSENGSVDGPGNMARFNNPNGIVVDGDSVLVADTDNNTLRRVLADGTTTTFAGVATEAGHANGTLSQARFDHPRGLARDSHGNIYVADTGNHTIRRISTDGKVSTLAGTPGVSGNSDGTGASACFNLPIALVADANNNIYVADTGNSAIRHVTTDGTVSTLTLTAAPPTPPPSPTPTPTNSGGGGGGGAMPVWVLAVLFLTSGIRLLLQHSQSLARKV